jgi:hypothetical protein
MREDDTVIQNADEQNWARIDQADELWAAPTEVAPPLIDAAPPLLNTHEMEWDAFERLLLRIARRLDGARDVRRYGISGQAQHGIDLVGFFDDKRPTIYQAKCVQAFGPGDLEEAVNKYGEGHRPFDAERMVIAVASEAHRTEIIEKLHSLRNVKPELEIDLWDRVQLSEILRDQPAIVTTFFGRTTAQRFCGMDAPIDRQETGSISADAILRGPISSLGLREKLNQAESVCPERPKEAAAIFANIAERLEASAFAAHAVRIREQQAAALVAAGSHFDAALVRLALGWRLIDAGDPFSAQVQVRHISDQRSILHESLVRAASALSAAASLRHEHSIALDDVAAAFDKLHDDDPNHAAAALFVAEEAVANQRPDLVTTRSAVFEVLASHQQINDRGQLLAARIRMCVADCGGGWAGLAADARLTYPPTITSLVLARYARHLSLTARPELSFDRWLDAIDRACAERHYDDAADWLYAIRAVKVAYGFVDDDLNEFHRRALALRASGGGTILPEPYHSRERALASMRDQKWPDALEAARRYVWRSTIGGDWSGEMEAHELLGDVFSATGRANEAIQHLIYSGQSKKLQALAARLPDLPVRLSPDLLSNAPWQRSAVYHFAASAADLMIDEDAANWASTALADIVVNGGHSVSVVSSDPVRAAFTAFGNLAGLSTEREAKRFLQIGRDLIPRRPNTYRFTDEAHALAVISIARAHPTLRKEAVEQLLQALLVDQRMAESVLSGAGDMLCLERDLVQRTLTEPASKDHYNAALALVIAECDTNAIEAMASKRVATAAAPRLHQPGVTHLGSGVENTSLLAGALPLLKREAFARAMVNAASDRDDAAMNRREALGALRVVARQLSDELRDELFEFALSYAKGNYEASRSDEFFSGGDDPLQRFRVRMGSTTLAPDGLETAAALARSSAQYAAVQNQARQMLPEADEQTSRAIAVALTSIPPDDISIDIELLGAHPDPNLRAVAAVIWAQRPNRHAAIAERLARDPSPIVRRSLASSLAEVPAHARVRTILAADPRRSIRNHAHRR